MGMKTNKIIEFRMTPIHIRSKNGMSQFGVDFELVHIPLRTIWIRPTSAIGLWLTIYFDLSWIICHAILNMSHKRRKTVASSCRAGVSWTTILCDLALLVFFRCSMALKHNSSCIHIWFLFGQITMDDQSCLFAEWAGDQLATELKPYLDGVDFWLMSSSFHTGTIIWAL